MDSFRIYYRDSVLIFGSKENGADGIVSHLAHNEAMTPAKVVKNFEINKSIYLVSDDPKGAFEEFCAQFVAVDAAGGVVTDEHRRLLMMMRCGWWDMPKGHVDPGEVPEQAAVREVREETGLDAELGELLTTTMHFYEMNGRWEMKRTYWYGMTYEGGEAPIPQVEEDIVEVCWLEGDALRDAMNATYSTIKDVVAVYEKKFK